MTERKPVAYMLSDFVDNDFTSLELPKNPNNPRGLYFKEQLCPRVKMTQAEFDEWNKLVEEVADLYTAVTEICDISPYPNLYCRFFDLQNEDTDKTRKTQVEFAILWGIFDEFNPDETIEIVPTKKWFVRSKKQYQPDMSQGISESGYLYLTQGDIYSVEYHEMASFKDEATQFNTEDEAKLWTTPDTEAVQLPVE